MKETLEAVTFSSNRTTVADVYTPFGGGTPSGDFVEYDDNSNLKYSDDTDVEYQ